MYFPFYLFFNKRISCIFPTFSAAGVLGLVLVHVRDVRLLHVAVVVLGRALGRDPGQGVALAAGTANLRILSPVPLEDQ